MRQKYCILEESQQHVEGIFCSQEIQKIFPNQTMEIATISINSNFVNEIQAIELLNSLNGGAENKWDLKLFLFNLENHLYEDEFYSKLEEVVEHFIKKVHSAVIVKVEELI